MKRFSAFLTTAGLAAVVALAGYPAIAQPAQPAKPLSQAALSAARPSLRSGAIRGDEVQSL